jgi:rare lipoprotein A (peptidoglycan hydrolase)
MKRWLIAVGLLVVGLLMVGRAGDALAARHSPTLLEKILSAFTPRPVPHRDVGAGKPVATRKAEPPVAKPVLTAQPVQAPSAAATPDPIARVIENRVIENRAIENQVIAKTQPVRDLQPDPASKPVRTTQTSRLAKPTRATQPANTAQPLQAAQPVQAAQPERAAQPTPAARVNQPVQAEPPIKIAPPIAVAQPELEPVQTGSALKKADFAKPKQPIKPSQFELASVGKAEPVHAEPPIKATQPIFVVQSEPVSKPVETTQTIKKAKPVRPTQTVQPMQVAILGAPNLKAALPAEAAAPLETPRPADEPRVPAVRPDPKSACNGGQRVVSAYYWEGHHTASGQPFNPHGMTAAHRTLPFGTRLNVTNPRTGKTVNVTINDRGPYVRGVSLDLSLGAAQAIGLQGTGSVCIL